MSWMAGPLQIGHLLWATPSFTRPFSLGCPIYLPSHSSASPSPIHRLISLRMSTHPLSPLFHHQRPVTTAMNSTARHRRRTITTVTVDGPSPPSSQRAVTVDGRATPSPSTDHQHRHRRRAITIVTTTCYDILVTPIFSSFFRLHLWHQSTSRGCRCAGKDF